MSVTSHVKHMTSSDVPGKHNSIDLFSIYSLYLNLQVNSIAKGSVLYDVVCSNYVRSLYSSINGHTFERDVQGYVCPSISYSPPAIRRAIGFFDGALSVEDDPAKISSSCLLHNRLRLIFSTIDHR